MWQSTSNRIDPARRFSQAGTLLADVRRELSILMQIMRIRQRNQNFARHRRSGEIRGATFQRHSIQR